MGGYKVLAGSDSSDRVFINSIKDQTVQIPSGGKLQFHVEPCISRQNLLKIIGNADSDSVTHRYNSFKVTNTIEFASATHKISFPLSLTCHLPELASNTTRLDFGSIFYGRSSAKEFTISNPSSHCQSWYSLTLAQQGNNFYFNSPAIENEKQPTEKASHQNGVLKPGEAHRVVINFSPDGTQLNYSANVALNEKLLGKISKELVL